MKCNTDNKDDILQMGKSIMQFQIKVCDISESKSNKYGNTMIQ